MISLMSFSLMGVRWVRGRQVEKEQIEKEVVGYVTRTKERDIAKLFNIW